MHYDYSIPGVTMHVDFSKRFQKQFKKLPVKKQLKARQAIALFLENPQAPSLRLHQLSGELFGVWSISAGGDLRLHFEYYGDTVVFFLAVGSHSQLY